MHGQVRYCPYGFTLDCINCELYAVTPYVGVCHDDDVAAHTAQTVSYGVSFDPLIGRAIACYKLPVGVTLAPTLLEIVPVILALRAIRAVRDYDRDRHL
jgi:hypothetical protein